MITEYSLFIWSIICSWGKSLFLTKLSALNRKEWEIWLFSNYSIMWIIECFSQLKFSLLLNLSPFLPLQPVMFPTPDFLYRIILLLVLYFTCISKYILNVFWVLGTKLDAEDMGSIETTFLISGSNESNATRVHNCSLSTRKGEEEDSELRPASTRSSFKKAR